MSGSWGYSTNGGDWFTTGFDTAEEAFGEGIQYTDGGLIVAFCTPTPLRFDAIDADDIAEDGPPSPSHLIGLFVDANDEANYEGDAFSDARRVDAELAAADLSTPELCEDALRAWADRMGGFPHGRTIDTSLDQSYGRDAVVLARITPGVREYDWQKSPLIRYDGLIFPWLDGSEGIGLGDMLWHD